jgi:hypothetical protein
MSYESHQRQHEHHHRGHHRHDAIAPVGPDRRSFISALICAALAT